MSLRVSVCITTHNRRTELERTLGELRRLLPAPDEILVCADGCTDGTVEWLRTAHAEVTVLVHSSARGSIPSRNELASAATGEILLSLDDDSYPLEADCMDQLRTLFAEHPRLAVASFPQRSDEFPESLHATSFGQPAFIGSFANSGAAIRRAAFQELGGYPGFFFHAYEEPDFALRCVCAGWQVRYEPAITIRHHFTGTQRNELRTHQRHARNELWSIFLRCPAPQCFGVALFRIARQFGYALRCSLSWAVREPVWWLGCLRGLGQCLRARRALPWRGYLGWMQLVRTPLASEAEWNRRFGGATR
jgi:GT2 family glycosyltransferase